MSYFFWGIIITMLVAAIMIVALPLGSAKRLLRSPRFLLAVMVPITAVGLYVALGTPAAITEEPPAEHQSPVSTNNGDGIPTIASLIDGLKARLQKQPDDGAGWLLLARSFDHLGQKKEALAAYEKATSLGQSHPELEKSLSGVSDTENAAANPASTGIRGRLSLSPEVAVQVQMTDTIFIFAKESIEQRMPVAALRKSVADLPLEFELSDEQAMVPGTSISDYAQLVVTAKVSRSGNASDTLSSFEVTSAPITPANGDLVELLITGAGEASINE